MRCFRWSLYPDLRFNIPNKLLKFMEMPFCVKPYKWLKIQLTDCLLRLLFFASATSGCCGPCLWRLHVWCGEFFTADTCPFLHVLASLSAPMDGEERSGQMRSRTGYIVWSRSYRFSSNLHLQVAKPRFGLSPSFRAEVDNSSSF